MFPIISYSTFDEYVAEVKSGRLEWSPVHKSDKFWVCSLAVNQSYQTLRYFDMICETWKYRVKLSQSASSFAFTRREFATYRGMDQSEQFESLYLKCFCNMTL